MNLARHNRQAMQKLTPKEIDAILFEFKGMDKDQNPKQFDYLLSYVAALATVLADRLKKGEAYLKENPWDTRAEDLYIELIAIYAVACQSLERHWGIGGAIYAAMSYFDAEVTEHETGPQHGE